jgi:hypothetical protein
MEKAKQLAAIPPRRVDDLTDALIEAANACDDLEDLGPVVHCIMEMHRKEPELVRSLNVVLREIQRLGTEISGNLAQARAASRELAA